MKKLNPTKLTILFLVIFISISYSQAPETKTSETDYLDSFYWWQTAVSKKPYSWYASEEGLLVAENILSWQYNRTGWPLMNTPRLPFEGDSLYLIYGNLPFIGHDEYGHKRMGYIILVPMVHILINFVIALLIK
jgi:hypothetical protein